MPVILLVQALHEEAISLTVPGCEVKQLFTGFGKVNAALALTDFFRHELPAMVWNVGTAGSLHHAVGSVVVCDRFQDRDMMQLEHLGSIHFASTTDKVRHLEPFMDLPPLGICNTGDQFVTHPDYHADVYDMEAFALARVCNQYQIPFLSFKYVTDIIGQNSLKIWEDKLEDARKELTLYFKNVLHTQ